MRDRSLAIHDKSTGLVVMVDHCGALFYINQAGRAILGLASNDNISGVTLIECIAPSDRARIAAAAIPTAVSRGVWSGDCALLARDGRQVGVSLQITAHHDAEGRLEGLSLLAQDMSEWTSAKKALCATQNELLRLSAHHMTIQEDERRRIAVDLHDGLGQSLGLEIVSLQNIASLLSRGDPQKAAECMDRLIPKARDTLDELRRIAMNLRPATLDSLGILATLSWHLREIEAACPEVRIERKFDIDETDVPKSLRTPIFRILQEAGSNAITHGEANRISVCLSKEQGVLELAIEDNGKGFDPDALNRDRRPNRGLGLQSMRERAALSCGIYEIKSSPGNGTQIWVRWPASVRDIGLGCVTVPESEADAGQDPGISMSDNMRDSDALRDFSACIACMRSVKNHE